MVGPYLAAYPYVGTRYGIDANAIVVAICEKPIVYATGNLYGDGQPWVPLRARLRRLLIIGDFSGVKISMAGNQWFAARDALNIINSHGFTALIETIPPGLVKRRIMGENLRMGSLILSYRPEIVSLPPLMLMGLETIETFEHVENDVVIAYVGDPVNDWCSLKSRRTAIPNPVTEGNWSHVCQHVR